MRQAQQSVVVSTYEKQKKEYMHSIKQLQHVLPIWEQNEMQYSVFSGGGGAPRNAPSLFVSVPR